ncbi:hypothetical protein ACFPYI_01680 [Halomarina salina]|uniref:Uncharacterized protein n=1 Tax=Halomarina salina TaxID=1872699 RepID=A0ABD5RIA2_9EURY|nr:hypothetical protein [Halomarina salina]
MSEDVRPSQGVEQKPKIVRDGFETVPNALRTDNLAVRCTAPEHLGDDAECSGWCESFDIDPSDVRVDGYGYLHFADHVPTECPECGGGLLAYNGVQVNFYV